MNYTDPRLREILAGEFVLGTLPPLTRARFERLMADDTALARLVGDWAEELAPLDAATAPVAPPARVWHAIESRLGPAAITPSAAPARWFDRLAVWRGLAAGGLAVAAALALYIAVAPPQPLPQVVAVLADHSGQPAWIATAAHNEILVSAVRPPPLDAAHALELWSIVGKSPHPLGLLPARADGRLALPMGALPAQGLLAVSLEPPGGSPTGLPTGPVLYQGRILGENL